MKIPSKLDLVLWALVGVSVLALGLVVKSWHDDAQELPKVRDQVSQLQDAYTELEQRAAKNAKKTEDHGHAFDQGEQKLATDRADTPTRDVRLCVNPVPETPRTAARDAAVADPAVGAGAGQLPEEPRRDPEEGPAAGPNIGPELYALIDEADRVALVAQRCQAWVMDNP